MWNIRFAPHAGLYAKANEPFLLLRELSSLGPIEVTADVSQVPELTAVEPDRPRLQLADVLPLGAYKKGTAR